MMGGTQQPQAAAPRYTPGSPQDPTSVNYTGFNPNSNWTDANANAQSGGALGAQVQASPAISNPGSAPNRYNSVQAQSPQTAQPQQPPGYQTPQSAKDVLASLQTPGPTFGTIQTGVNTANVPALAGGADLSKAMTDQQQAAYKQAAGYLDPQWTNAQTSLQNQLVNQGIPQNSEAWNKAMDDFNRNKTFAYGQAQNSAVQQGNAAQAQLFGQGLASNQNQFGQNLSGGQFSNSAQNQGAQQLLQNNQLNELISQNTFGNSLQERQQAINEMLMQQQNPLQMYQSLTQGGSVNQPNFSQTPGANVGGTDIASIIQQALGQQNNVYNTQVGSQNSQTAGYAAILAALLSDRRLKKNVVCIGKHVSGVPLYRFDYLWDEPGIGVMADELEKVRPDAVFDVDGFKVVDYGRI